MVLAGLLLLMQDVELPGGNVLACETYSLHRLFKAKENPLTLEAFPAKMKDLGIRGISLNDIYFASWEDAYLEKVKAAIAGQGRVVVAFIIDINGNFALEDEGKRRENVEAVRKRLKVARFFGAPVVRVNVGRTGKGDEADGTVGVERVTAAFKELIPTAKELGLKLSIENHWGCSTRADWVLKTIRGSDPEWVGSCLDFKNWPKGSDIYGEIAKLARHAFHTHVKTHAFNAEGDETGCDYGRAFKILREAGYKGALSIEWEGEGDPIDGVKKTRELIRRHWKQ